MIHTRSAAMIARVRRLARDHGVCDFRSLAEAALELASEAERLESVIREMEAKR
jgi:hypothetical protein